MQAASSGVWKCCLFKTVYCRCSRNHKQPSRWHTDTPTVTPNVVQRRLYCRLTFTGCLECSFFVNYVRASGTFSVVLASWLSQESELIVRNMIIQHRFPKSSQWQDGISHTVFGLWWVELSFSYPGHQWFIIYHCCYYSPYALTQYWPWVLWECFSDTLFEAQMHLVKVLLQHFVWMCTFAYIQYAIVVIRGLRSLFQGSVPTQKHLGNTYLNGLDKTDTVSWTWGNLHECLWLLSVTIVRWINPNPLKNDMTDGMTLNDNSHDIHKDPFMLMICVMVMMVSCQSYARPLKYCDAKFYTYIYFGFYDSAAFTEMLLKGWLTQIKKMCFSL